MKIEQLEQLIRIVECGSMNLAAEKMYIARSSLSTSMKHLEDELGEKIFLRHSNGVSLTSFGASVYSHAREICSRIDFLQSVSTEKNRQLLHVSSMYCSMASDAFAEFVLRNREEQLEASIEEASAHDVIRLVSKGLSEIGVLTLFPDTEDLALRKLNNEGLEYHELVQRRLGVLVGASNPLFSDGKDLVELHELVSFPFVENSATPTDHAWAHRIIPEENRKGRYVVSDLGLALRLVSETDAVMIDVQNDTIYRRFYAGNDYRFLPIADYPKCSTGWIRHKAFPLSGPAQKYVDILTEIALQGV